MSDYELWNAMSDAERMNSWFAHKARLAEAEYNTASAHKGWNNTIDAHSRAAARLAEAEALLRNVPIDIADASAEDWATACNAFFAKLEAKP